MTIRILGAILILIGCGGFGALAAVAYKRETSTLKSFVESMDIMESELRYRKTPLPQLCHYIADIQSGVIKSFFLCLESELLRQVQPDAATCAVQALKKTQQMPKHTVEMILQFTKTLGKFDVEGQLLGIQAVKSEATLRLNQMSKDQAQRMKNYRTLGVCAGAAIIILFI